MNELLTTAARRTAVFAMSLLAAQAGLAAEHALRPGDAFDAVVRRLQPGDVLKVMPGLYTDGWTIVGLQGTRDRPITIRGEKGAIMRPKRSREGIIFWGGLSRHVVIDGLTIEKATRAGIIISHSEYITIRNCTIRSNRVWGVQTCLSHHVTVENCELAYSAEQHGLYFSTTDYPVVRNCHIHHNAGCGVHMNGDVNEGGDGLISHGLVLRNRIHHNGKTGGAAVNLDGVERTTVAENVISDNVAGGIVSFVQNGASAGTHNVFRQNSVTFDRGKGRFALSLVGGSRDATVERNILSCGRGPAMLVDAASINGLRSESNVFWSPTPGAAFVIGEQKLDLQRWRVRTGQDRTSEFSKGNRR